MEAMGKRARVVVILVVVLATIGIDQGIKRIAIDNLMGNAPVRVLGGFGVFEYAENTGAFLSILANAPEVLKKILLVIVPIAVCLGGLVYILWKSRFRLSESIALACVIGGGLGNLIDRLLFGKVVDYLHVGFGSLRTGVLNFADLAVTFGAIVFLVLSWQQSKKTKVKKDQPG